MTPDIVLLVLRLLSAAILLLFLVTVVWLVLKDMRTVRAALAERRRNFGTLRVIGANNDQPPHDTQFPLSPITSIGRAASNTVVLEDDYVSGEHALLMLRGQQWWLEDLNSRNGTLLNGTELSEATVISAGDVITIGNTRLKIEPPLPTA